MSILREGMSVGLVSAIYGGILILTIGLVNLLFRRTFAKTFFIPTVIFVACSIANCMVGIKYGIIAFLISFVITASLMAVAAINMSKRAVEPM